MKRLLKLKYGFLFAITLFIVSCETEDFTGYSTLTPTNPTVTISGIPASISFVEIDSIFTFTATMSTAQIVDVVIYVTQASGSASEGDDFVILNDGGKLTIPAGSTTGLIKVKVLSDDVAESTENFTIQIGDERTSNAILTPVSVSFTILNSTSNVFSAEMSWNTDVLTVIGVNLKPTDVVDLRMLIIDDSDAVVDVADDSGFETWDGFNALPDGVYRIATDIFSSMSFGDINKPINIDITLDFNQLGVINSSTLFFAKAFTNEFVCETYRVYLATITKLGNNYTIEKSLSRPSNSITGIWFGTDTEFEYDSQVETILGCDFKIKGLGFEWMEDFWAETIIAGGSVLIEYDDVAKTVTIPEQYYFTTLYAGDEYPYTIVGSGTYDDSGEFTTLTITYELFQDGWSPSLWCFQNGYMDNDDFTATLTLDPAGKVVGKKVVPNIPKPKR
jgi:hypothetical protein